MTTEAKRIRARERRKHALGSTKPVYYSHCIWCDSEKPRDYDELCARCQRRVERRARAARVLQAAAEKRGECRKRPSVDSGPPEPFVPRFVIDTSVRRSGVGKLFE